MVLHKANHSGAPSMAEDQEKEEASFVEEVQTDEFLLPKEEREDELVVATLLSAGGGSVQDSRALVAAALRELEAVDDDGRKARLHHSLGLIIEHRLGDPRRALHHYLEALRLAPTSLSAIRSARRLFWSRQNWTMVLTLIDSELGLVSNPARSARLLLEKGWILEEWLVSSDKAQQAYLEALQKDPSNRQVLARLRMLYWRKQDHVGLLDVCRRAAAATRDRKYRGVLLAEVARILEEHLDDMEGAIATYASAFVEDPTLAASRSALKRLYHRYGRWGELADVLLTEGDLAASDTGRAQIYIAAARMCRDRLGQVDRALEMFARVRRIRPADPGVLEEVADLLQQAGRHVELAEVYQQLLEHLHDTWGRVLTHYRLGRLLEERLGREDEAIIHYRRAVALDSTYVPALQSLGKLYQRRGLWAELVAMNTAEAEVVADAESRASRFCGLAELCETQLRDLPRAIEFHRRALAAVPHYAPAERALLRLYTMDEDWSALVDLLDSQLELLSGEAAGRQLERLGQLCEEKLREVDRAVGFYQRALELMAGDVPLQRALQRLYAESERWGQFIEALDQEVRHTTDGDLKLALMHKAAEICETKLNDPDGAVVRYRKILEVAPAHGPTLSSLGRIAYRQGKWEEVLALYRAEVEQGKGSPERLGSLLYKMGEIYQDHLADEESALRAFSRALDATPNYLPALQALAQLHRKRQEWEKLLTVMRRQADLQADPEQKAMALCSVAELCETRLGQQALAVQHYRQAVELCPGHEPSLSAIMRVLGSENRWREVVDLNERALAATTDDATTLFTLKRLGELWDRRLLNASRAVECYEQALAISPEDVETLEALARLYARTGDHERQVAALDRLAFRAKDPAEAVAHLLEAARVLEVHLPQRDPTPVYERIIQQDPEEVTALAALLRIYGERADRAARERVCGASCRLEEDAEAKGALLLQVAETREAGGDVQGAEEALGEATRLLEDWLLTRELRRVRERLGHWEGVAEALEREASLTRNRGAAVDVLLRAATLHQDRFLAPDRAIPILCRVLEEDPFHDEAAVRLEQLLVQREAWQELVDVLRRRLEAAATKRDGVQHIQAQIELLARMAWIQREHLQQPAEAIATLMRSVALDPNHLPTLLTLAELHLGLEQWQEAVDAYAKIVAVSDDPDVLRSAHYRLGELWSEKLNDVRRAISSYQNVLAIAPNDIAALAKLYELFSRAKDWENAADIVARLIDVESQPARLVEHFAALADIQEKGFGDPRLAAEQLQHALAIDPTNETILQRFSNLAAHLGDWEALADAIRSFLVALAADQEGRGIHYRVQLGDVLKRRLGKVAEALEQFRAVVEIDPTHVEARLATAALLAEEGRYEEAIVEHREVQEIDGLNVESLSQMRDIWSRAGNQEMAYAVAAALVCLGEAQEADEQIYHERRSKGVRYPQLPLESSAHDSVLVHPGENTAGRRVLTVLGEIAHRIRPPVLEDWHVTKADRLPPRSEDPLKILVREVALLVGLEREIEIFISPTRSRELDLLLTDPPSLVVGAGVMGAFSSMEVRFTVAQLLSWVRNRTWVAYRLDGDGLYALLQAAMTAVDLGAAGEPPSELARAIQRNLSRRGRRALEEACHGLSPSREPDPKEWARAMAHTALRTALWAVNDFETALDCLRRGDPQLADTGAGITARVRRSDLATELVHFWLSEDYLSLKRSAAG
jgi:tetratricopeptide (TPR) repeat protein